jgi:hypothetical protein
MIGKERMMLLAFATAIMAMVVIITSSSISTPVFAIGHFDESGESDIFGGTPTNDMSSEFDSEEDHSSGYDTYLGGPNKAISGFPSEETATAGLPEQTGDEVGAHVASETIKGTSVPSKKIDADTIYYKEFQACLSDTPGRVTPTEQEVQACLESSYGDNTSPVESSGGDDANGDTRDVFADDAENDENEEDEDESEASEESEHSEE